MSTWALDTNSVSYFMRGRGRVASRLAATPRGSVALPAVVLYELRAGAAKLGSGRLCSAVESLAAGLRILPFGDSEARAAAEVRVRLEAEGRPIGPYDTLIAGTALANGLVLVTHNMNEFGRVQGLRLEDWL